MTSDPWPKAIVVVPQARTGVGYDALPNHDVRVQNTRRHGLGKKDAHEPWRGLGYRGTRIRSHTATPRWSPPCAIVTLPRWPAGGGARDPVPWPPRLDQGTPQIAC